MNTSWRANNDVDALLQDADVFLNYSASDTSMDLDVHIFSNRMNDKGCLSRKLTSWSDNECLAVHRSGVNGLKHSDGESTSFSCS